MIVKPLALKDIRESAEHAASRIKKEWPEWKKALSKPFTVNYRNCNDMKKTLWFAAGGGLFKCGPFQSESDAWRAMILTQKEQAKQQSIHPEDTRVWCEDE